MECVVCKERLLAKTVDLSTDSIIHRSSGRRATNTAEYICPNYLIIIKLFLSDFEQTH
jgi:hypothetical protein